MIILGIHEGHDAGAAIVKDGEILSAVNEERLVRKKLFMGVPRNSIIECMRIAKLSPDKIDKVAIAGILGTMAPPGWENISFKKKIYQFICNYTPFPKTHFFINLQRALFRSFRNKSVEKYIRSIGIDAPIEYVDHHKCHAASTYYTSGKEECLIITSDGSGDGVSSSVYIGKDNELRLLKEFPTFHSIAYYYGYITQIAGFKMFRHEGKIMGLAAYGNPQKVYKIFEKCFSFKDGRPVNNLGVIGETAINFLKRSLRNVSMEDYSAALQKRTEDVISKYIDYYVKEKKIYDVAVAGGLFANVKVNQRVLELPAVNSLFIHPHMGDGGIAVGAALAVSAAEMANEGNGLKPYKLKNVYFGPSYSNDEILEAIENNKLKGEYIRDIERYVAEKLEDGKVVGYFDGRMEYGPRALGNRSILADPTDTSINKWLNKRLRRTEFMPFAPSILDTAAPDYYENYISGRYPAQFMTITFNTTKEAQKARAVIHVDNTTRPHVVSKQSNPRYYKILENYRELTGLPLFVNTSFNIHEEPIVCSPDSAIKSYLNGIVDVLVMGNWVLER